jgi:hypothetical protein
MAPSLGAPESVLCLPALQLLEAIACQNGTLGSSLGSGLTVHALGQQVAPNRGLRSHGRVAHPASHAQIVQVQLRRPAWMLAVLGGQRRNGHSAQAGESSLVAAQAVLERGNGVRRTPRSAYFRPSWTAFQADRGRHFSVIVDGVSD